MSCDAIQPRRYEIGTGGNAILSVLGGGRSRDKIFRRQKGDVFGGEVSADGGRQFGHAATHPAALFIREEYRPRSTWSETPAWFRTKLFVASDASIALSFSDVSDAHQFFTSPLRSSNNLDYRANPPHGRNTDIGCR